MRYLTYLLLLIFLLPLVGGCARLCPEAKSPLLPEQEAFMKGLDAFRSGQGTALLDALAARYPDSVWSARAEALVKLHRDLEQAADDSTDLEQQADAAGEQISRLKQKIAEQEARLQRYAADNRELAETIEQLKGLLIELEQQPQ